MNEKLRLYKTAFSPMYNCYVGIQSIHYDVDDNPILKVHLAGEPENDYVLFRPNELTDYCL